MTTLVFYSEGRPGYGAGPQAWKSFTDEIERRGFKTRIVESVRGATPHQDRADAIVEALKDEADEIVVVGISNQGCILALVADARPVRRLVYVNALIPQPGRAVVESFKEEGVFAPEFTDQLLQGAVGVDDAYLRLMNNPATPEAEKQARREVAQAANGDFRFAGFFEICRLRKMPDVENVYISAELDEFVRPQWQQEAARRLLGVEPVIIKGAGHGGIFNTHAKEVADACTAGLQP